MTDPKTMSKADILAEVSDSEIEHLRQRKQRIERVIERLQRQLDDARDELAEAEANIDQWVEDVRREFDHPSDL